MKKTYQNPEMKVVKIQVAQMIAASPEGFKGALGTEGGDGSGALGRRGGDDLWDDDEE